MKVSIHQPCYLPWLGHFHRVLCSDVHIVLDHVKINHASKTKFANRNKIRTSHGWSWLTVPLAASNSEEEKIMTAVRTAPLGWEKKHWLSLKSHYGKAAYFQQHKPFWEKTYSREWSSLTDLCRETTDYLYEQFQMKPSILYSSKMNVPGAKEELILNLCREVGATQYLSGPFGKDYLDLEAFHAAHMEVVFHEYQHPVYEQAFPGFEPYMFAPDLLLNHGPGSLAILSANQTLFHNHDPSNI